MGSRFNIQHNRAFGIHWGVPFSNSLSKARDPHINLWTLKRLLKNPSTAQAAAKNLLSRKIRDSKPVPLFIIIMRNNFPHAIKLEALKIMENSRPCRRKFFIALAKESAQTIAAVHALWLTFKPAELRPNRSSHATRQDPASYVEADRSEALVPGVIRIFDIHVKRSERSGRPYSVNKTMAYQIGNCLFVTSGFRPALIRVSAETTVGEQRVS